MAAFIGDYTARVDAKGRIILPSAFKKQMSAPVSDKFVVKKDIFEKCLVLYPLDEWERMNDIIRQKTNPYNKKHNEFLRGFYKGTAEVELDASNRFLIQKRLLDEAGIEKEVVLAGQDGKIEIWAKDHYDKVSTGDDFAKLAESIMGGNLNTEE
jgi:MraZ protein